MIISCKKENVIQENGKKVKSEFNRTQKRDTVTSVKSSFKNEVKNWEELTALETLIHQFKEVSINEALSSAKDLNDLATSLKDSMKPEKFDMPSFEARIHVFYNETLRLVDLTSIEDISLEEADEQIKKILEAYSAINSKINIILKEDALEKLIDSSLEGAALDSLKKITVPTMKSLQRESEFQKIPELNLQKVN